MELSAQNLEVLFTGAEMVFQRGFEMPPSYYEKVSSVTKSGTRQNVYPFMGRTTQFREWFGEREVQNLEAHTYTLVNKHFEDTVGVDIDDLEDDQFGVYTPMIEQLGWDAKVHPDVLMWQMVANALSTIDAPSDAGAVIGYDGKTFFSASHPVGLSGRSSTSTPNCYTGGSDQYWLLINAFRPIRPFIAQIRKPYTLTRMNAFTDEKVFDQKQLRFGVDARINVGVGLWQLAYASNADLSNPANFGAAITAMRAIKTDAGRPFGSWNGPPTSKFLMVGRSNEEVARQLLHSTFGAIAGASAAVAGVPGTNVYQSECELIVNEYLP